MAGRLAGRSESGFGWRFGKIRTVKAPGTEKITTFFPFHSSVFNWMAVQVIVNINWRSGFVSYGSHMQALRRSGQPSIIS